MNFYVYYHDVRHATKTSALTALGELQTVKVGSVVKNRTFIYKGLTVA